MRIRSRFLVTALCAAAIGLAQGADGADPLQDVIVSSTVKQTLAADPRLAGTAIEVAAVAGVVTLQGRVPDLSLHEHAARLARAVFGVTRVDNRLTVTRALG
jgi:hyperosmotically inducible periplasmic protein